MGNDPVRLGAIHFVAAVFARPAMYTLRGTYEEAHAFVHGYLCGQTSINPDSMLAQVWFELGESLKPTYGEDGTAAFLKFRDAHASNEDACQAMVEHILTVFPAPVQVFEKQIC